MKKTLLIAAAALISASAFADDNVVSSANIVGYVKIDSIGDAITLPGSQFMVGTGNTISETLGDALPMGSKVYAWTGSGYANVEYTYLVEEVPQPFPNPSILVTNGVGWTADGETVSGRALAVGEGFWLQNAGAAGTTNEVIIAGDVVLDGTVTNNIYPELNLLSSPYSAETAITNFGFNAAMGDKIYAWTGSGYANVEYTYLVEEVPQPFPNPSILVTNGVGWTADGETVSDRVMAVGEGFWYQSTSATTNEWIMTRPFNVD